MENKDYLKNIDGAERRFFAPDLKIEVRAEGEEKPATIEGHAAIYNSVADLGWFHEEILPGAFDEVLNDDVRALFNHDPNLILARSVNGKGTLTLSVDERGLKYAFEAPDTTAGRDLKTNIELGNISQSSFGFRVKEDIWHHREGMPDLRQVVKYKRLFDVSPVTYPAYTDTTVAKRSHDQAHQSPEPIMDEYEARHRLLKLKIKNAN